MARAIMDFRESADARVLVVTGAGDESFCAGADLRSADSLLEHQYVLTAGPMGFARLDPGKPTIAAVNGYCVAGGMELAAWCDFRICSENAVFGAFNRRWGVPFLDGGTQRFPRIVGLSNALYLMETGIRIPAERALQMGFVQEVVPQGKALDRCLELAGRIADYPQTSIRGDREAALRAHALSLLEGIEEEMIIGRAALADPEMTKGLNRFAEGDRPSPPE